MESILERAMSSDVATRQAAEKAIEEYAVSKPEELFTGLFTIGRRDDVGKEMAQMTMLVAKAVVLHHWGPEFEQFRDPIFKNDIKNDIRRGLLETVATSSFPQVRATAAAVVARIGSYEYPDQWPDLLQNTVSLLRADGTALAGGLELFKELLVDTLRERDFFEVGEFVLGRLLEVAHTREYQLLSLQCFHECINFFLMGDDDQLPVLESIARKHVVDWCDLFKRAIIAQPQEGVFQNEIINTLRDLESAFPEVLAPEVPMLFKTVVERLEASFNDAGVRDDNLLTHQINLLDMLFRAKGSKVIHDSMASDDLLERFLNMSLAYARIPQELQHLWVDDFNDFVLHEVEMSDDVWPRPAIGNLMGDLRQPTILSQLIGKAKSATSWIDLEAALFLVSCVLQQISVESQRVSAQQLADLVALIKEAREPELLQARAIITAGHVAKFAGAKIDNDSQIQLFGLAFNIASDAPRVVKVASLRNIAIGCEVVPDKMRPFQKSTLSLVSELIEDSEEETPALLADIMMSILRLDFDNVLTDDQMYSLFFSLVAKDTANIELTVELLTFVEDLFENAEKRPETLAVVYQKLLVPVIQILTSAKATNYEYTSDLQFALDLATVVFERGADLPDRSQFLQLLHDLVSTCEDPQILQSGSFAYAALLERLGNSELDSSTIQSILEVAAKLLDPNLSDSSGLASGRLVKAIFSVFGSELGDLLAEIIVAAGVRLAAAENALLIESLTLLYFELINHDAASVVNLLAERNLLEVVLKKCLATFEVVRGADEIYNSVTALQKLYDLDDSRVAAIHVNDEALAPRNKILTRSATKNMKFTQVSVPVKIVKLLIRELGQSQQPDFDEDDEWADELTLGFNGEALTDRRIHGLIMDWFRRIGRNSENWYPYLNETERQTLLEASNI